MSNSLGSFRYRRGLTAGALHTLLEDLVIDLPYDFRSCRNCHDGFPHVRLILGTGTYVLRVPRGFRWNGASGPTWDTDGIRRASLVHDALYGILKRDGYDSRHRQLADRIFYHHLRQMGVNPARRWYYYAAVRLFGRKAAGG